MRKDINKHIDSIRYNLLNLPEQIIFENGNRIKYYYDASGTKWRKEVSGSDTSTTDYVGILILENDTLKTKTAEGSFEQLTLDFTAQESGYLYVYVSNESNLDVNVYFLRPPKPALPGEGGDDLKINHTSILTIVHRAERDCVSAWRVVEARADDYYPGVYPAESGRLSFNSFFDTTEIAQKFLYNGKELQKDLTLDWYDYGVRMPCLPAGWYDASLGRFHVHDSYAEKYLDLSPYHPDPCKGG